MLLFYILHTGELSYLEHTKFLAPMLGEQIVGILADGFEANDCVLCRKIF